MSVCVCAGTLSSIRFPLGPLLRACLTHFFLIFSWRTVRNRFCRVHSVLLCTINRNGSAVVMHFIIDSACLNTSTNKRWRSIKNSINFRWTSLLSRRGSFPFRNGLNYQASLESLVGAVQRNWDVFVWLSLRSLYQNAVTNLSCVSVCHVHCSIVGVVVPDVQYTWEIDVHLWSTLKLPMVRFSKGNSLFCLVAEILIVI